MIRTEATRRGLAVAGAATILLAVGGPAAVASYRHAADVAATYGETVMAPWLPLTTDGMLVAAIVAMYWRRWRGQRVGPGPWLAFALGLAATLGANLAAAQPTTGGYVVAVWPPVAFALTLELLAVMIGRGDIPEPVPAAEPEPVHDASAPDPVRAVTVPEPVRGPVRLRASIGPLIPALDMPDPAHRPTGWTVDDERIRREIVVSFVNGGPAPSQRSIRSEYGIGPARSRRIAESLDCEPARSP